MSQNSDKGRACDCLIQLHSFKPLTAPDEDIGSVMISPDQSRQHRGSGYLLRSKADVVHKRVCAYPQGIIALCRLLCLMELHQRDVTSHDAAFPRPECRYALDPVTRCKQSHRQLSFLSRGGPILRSLRSLCKKCTLGRVAIKRLQEAEAM